jgi:hypothetical protein
MVSYFGKDIPITSTDCSDLAPAELSTVIVKAQISVRLTRTEVGSERPFHLFK